MAGCVAVEADDDRAAMTLVDHVGGEDLGILPRQAFECGVGHRAFGDTHMNLSPRLIRRGYPSASARFPRRLGLSAYADLDHRGPTVAQGAGHRRWSAHVKRRDDSSGLVVQD